MEPVPIPLQPEDRAILELESATIAGHTCKVIRIGPGAPGVDAIRARVAARIASVPALSMRLGGTDDAPAWVTWGGFDVAEQVRAIEVDTPLSDADLPEHATRLFEQRLDRSRPLWRMDVAPVRGDGAVLIWRIHHALADGTAAMRFARGLLWDGEPAATHGSPDRSGPVRRTRSGTAEDHAGDSDRRRRHLAAFVEREFGESIRRSPFDGRIGTLRQIAFATVAMRPLHDAARSLADATLNDAVLSLVAGSVRRWLEHHHGSLAGVRVRVPVSLHREGDAVANRDSFFTLQLPLNEPDPVPRLRAVQAATSVRKVDHDAEQLEELVRKLGSLSPRMESFCKRLEASPRSFALSVSNVPGPREPVSVCGAPVEAVHSLAEIGARHALRVAVVSLAGELHFGLCADPAIVDDLDSMARGIEIEAAELLAAG